MSDHSSPPRQSPGSNANPPERVRARLRRRGSLLAASSMVLAVLVAPSSPAVGKSDPAPPAPAEGPVTAPIALNGLGAGSPTITLVTGDTVQLKEAGGGRYSVTPQATVRPDGSRAHLSTMATPNGVYVTPSDAAPAILAGRLDRELFNVTYLAENGYTDDKSKQLPVIVQYPRQRSAAAVASAAEKIPASTPEHTLESINASAVKVTKAEAGAFWSAVRAVPEASAAGGVAGLDTVPGTLRGGLAKVWLDRKAKAVLDVSVPMIGAPAAWAGGHDGAGVKVAVLDTGIDAGHPDLAGKVVAGKSFIPGEDIRDGHGHGTHVASTIAGSGAAAGGQYKGVAPGAQLIVGKVLDNSGTGADSGIIEAMEWAAAGGAKVISMSLGGGPTDGTDPMSQAVNTLSASTGALFVIAAGNLGDSGTETVATPGTADAALTVAAVDKADNWATFSSQGPRMDDGALKPDIAAPGVSIAAARAMGTGMGSPVGDSYTAASGTSMATPHVAGAVAILAQQHPDWNGPQLKAALMSTAKDDVLSAYKQGAGRVDLGRAHAQQVFASTGSLDFTTVNDHSEGLNRELTYINHSPQPVTLTLTAALSGSDGSAVAAALKLADTTLTVPAAGSATTTVTLDPAALDSIDNYYGAVSAVADQVQLRTPVGAVRAVPTATLTVRTIGRDGKPGSPFAQDSIDVAGKKGLIGGTRLTAEGTTVTRVPHGTISVAQLYSWIDEDDRATAALLLDPEVTVTGDTEIVLDARTASVIRFDTPKPADPLNTVSTMAYQRTTADGDAYMGAVFWNLPIGAWGKLAATPTKQVTKGKLRFHSRFALGQAEVAMSVRKPHGQTLHPAAPQHGMGVTVGHGQEAYFPDFRPFTGRSDLQLLDVGEGRPEDLAGRDLRGKLVLLQVAKSDGLFGPACGVQIERIALLRDAGVAGVVHFPLPGTGCPIPLGLTQKPFTGPAKPVGVPNVSLPAREALALREQLADGPVTITLTGTPESPYTYTLAPYEEGRIPQSLHYKFTGRDLAEIEMDIHAVAPAQYSDWRNSWKMDDAMPLASSVSDWGLPILKAQRRQDWVGPLDRDLLHSHGMMVMPVPTAEPTPQDVLQPQWLLEVFDTPTRTRQSWLTAPFTPGAATGPDKVMRLAKGDPALGAVFRCMICVRGNVLWAEFEPASGGPAGRQYNADFWKADTFYEQTYDVRLYRNGQEIPRSPVQDTTVLPHFTLPKDPGKYRLTAKNARNDTEWTFTTPVGTERLAGSSCSLEFLYGTAERCQPAPVVFVSYDLGDTLAADNSVRAGRPHTFTVNPYHSPSGRKMPAIAGLKLWASTDDGATYQPVAVKPNKDGSYTAKTRYPDLRATKGAVTLKVEAWDEEGNTINQASIRAFNLRK
ncbi:S8 family serine peptidase [Kribbella sancticallisti]|uniref:S8 family serine peptidase n=1 Tax=Kribbella sancticallisti TaxID=460087 RepID=A0ABP4PIN3_9ACTN